MTAKDALVCLLLKRTQKNNFARSVIEYLKDRVLDVHVSALSDLEQTITAQSLAKHFIDNHDALYPLYDCPYDHAYFQKIIASLLPPLIDIADLEDTQVRLNLYQFDEEEKVQHRLHSTSQSIGI